MFWIGLLACGVDGSESIQADTDVTATDTVIDDGLFVDVSVAVVEEMPTTFTVTFETTRPVSAWIEHGAWQSPPSDPALQHSVLAIGAAPGEAVDIRPVAMVDGQRVEGEVVTVEAGWLTDWPSPTVHVDGQLDGLLLAVFQHSEQPWAAVFRGDGQVCWARPLGMDANRVSVVVQPSVLGGLWVDSYDGDRTEADGKLHRLDLRGKIVDSVNVDLGHHGFVERADGGLAYLAVDIRETETWGSVVGDQIIEIDADGSHRTIFSTWDELTVRESSTWWQGFYPQGHDWTHGSGLSWDEHSQVYTVSLAGTQHVIALDRQGDITARIAGSTIDADAIQTAPDDAQFVRPHGAHWTQDGDLLVFSSANLISRGGRYRVDVDAAVAEETARYGEELGHHALTMGSLEELPDGRLLMVWGSAGVVDVLDADGSVAWRMQTPLGTWISDAVLLDGPHVITSP